MQETPSARRWRYWRQAAGAVSIVLSMVFVGVEIRQNTEAARSATFQQLADARQDLLLEWTRNPSVFRAWQAWVGRTEMGTVPEADRYMGSIWTGAYVSFLNNAYYQVELNTLPLEAFEGWIIDDMVRSPNFFNWWGDLRLRFSDSFRGYMESNYPLAPTS